MSDRLFYEQINVGDRWVSPSRTITESDIIGFAGLTGDYDPLHVDHEYASQTPFGRPIAHGLLGISFVAGLGSNSPCVNTMAFVAIQKWEFLRPAFIGDTVHVETEVTETRDSGRRCGHVSWKRQLVNQTGVVLQSGIFETLVNTQAAAERKTRRDAAKPKAAQTPPHAPAHKFAG